MKHCYYIASLDQTFGDSEMDCWQSMTLKEVWQKYSTWNNPQRHEGVSRFQYENGDIKTVVWVRDFFKLQREGEYPTYHDILI